MNHAFVTPLYIYAEDYFVTHVIKWELSVDVQATVQPLAQFQRHLTLWAIFVVMHIERVRSLACIRANGSLESRGICIILVS